MLSVITKSLASFKELTINIYVSSDLCVYTDT